MDLEELKRGFHRQYEPEFEIYEENQRLKNKVEGLQDRIDSAINYIENEAIIENLKADHTYITINQDNLLDILKGDNK